MGPGPRSFPLPRARLHTFENLSLTFTSTSFPHHFFPHASQVAKWTKRELPEKGKAAKNRVLWPDDKPDKKVNVHRKKCVHLSMFTQARWVNIVLCRPEWLKGFQDFVDFLDGAPDAADKLRDALKHELGTEWDGAYAIQMEAHRRDWLEKYGFNGIGE